MYNNAVDGEHLSPDTYNDDHPANHPTFLPSALLLFCSVYLSLPLHAYASFRLYCAPLSTDLSAVVVAVVVVGLPYT